MAAPGAFLTATSATRDMATVMSAAAGFLRAWVGLGPAFLATADPASGGLSGAFAFDIPDSAAAAFYANELSGRDVVRFESLARAPVPIASLYAATAGEPDSSARWRDVIAPLGWGDELRAAITSQGRTWGYLCLHREATERPFSAKDVARLARVLPVLAGALRRAALAAERAHDQLDTGVLLLDGRGRLTGSTGGAAAWLDDLGAPGSDGLPFVLAGLARHVLETGQPVTSGVTSRTGRSGVVEAAALDGSSESRVAMVISSASPARRLDQLAAAGGLTPREVEIVHHVLAGRSTKAISSALGISPYTVQAHLTSVFRKTGQRTRRELVSRLQA